jgi:hypothetical protein
MYEKVFRFGELDNGLTYWRVSGKYRSVIEIDQDGWLVAEAFYDPAGQGGWRIRTRTAYAETPAEVKSEFVRLLGTNCADSL